MKVKPSYLKVHRPKYRKLIFYIYFTVKGSNNIEIFVNTCMVPNMVVPSVADLFVLQH